MKTQFAELTWPEVQEAAKAVVMVPVGATEQHGHHLPLLVDWFLVSEVAQRAAERARQVNIPTLVTPPVWTGFSPHHMDFAGTISLDAPTFMAVVRQIAGSLWHHGFRKILLLNGHGGNVNLLRGLVQQLRFEDGIKAVTASYWDYAVKDIGAWRESAVGGINHACEMETSLMLALKGDLVRSEKARDVMIERSAYLAADLTVAGTVTAATPFAELSETGVIGTPSLASAERGEELIDVIVKHVSDFIAEFHTWPE